VHDRPGRDRPNRVPQPITRNAGPYPDRPRLRRQRLHHHAPTVTKHHHDLSTRLHPNDPNKLCAKCDIDSDPGLYDSAIVSSDLSTKLLRDAARLHIGYESNTALGTMRRRWIWPLPR
jgi:hypothetical protein